MNRRGSGEALALFMFLTIMLILLAGIVVGVHAFFGRGYDFREAEVDQLEARMTSCFMQHDFFQQGFSITGACDIAEGFLDSDHLVVFRSDSSDRAFVMGVADYEQQCGFTGALSNRRYPRCVNGTLTKHGESFFYIIGSNHESRKVLG